MEKLMRFFKKDEEGVTAIEYSLIAALIGVAIVVTVMAVGGSVNDVFANVSTTLNGALK